MSGLYHFIYLPLRTPLSVFCLPAGSPPRLRAAWRVLAPFAVLLWTAMIVSTGWSFTPAAMDLLGRAALLVGGLAGVCWAVAVAAASLRDREIRTRDREIRTLARENADFWERIPEAERPPLLRSAR